MIVMRDGETWSAVFCQIEEIAIDLGLGDRFLKHLIVTGRESLVKVGRVRASICRICIEPEFDH